MRKHAGHVSRGSQDHWRGGLTKNGAGESLSFFFFYIKSCIARKKIKKIQNNRKIVKNNQSIFVLFKKIFFFPLVYMLLGAVSFDWSLDSWHYKRMYRKEKRTRCKFIRTKKKKRNMLNNHQTGDMKIFVKQKKKKKNIVRKERIEKKRKRMHES